MELKKVEYFTIYCATGCSCCNGENHYRGPFSTHKIAEERVTFYSQQKLLASQYAPNGRYEINGPYEGEQLPDGRIIGDERVHDGFADDYLVSTDEEIISS